MDRHQLERVRSFNRVVTRRVGALDDSYLERGRPLGEARLLFEIGAAGGGDIRQLRRKLGLDSGYMSRLLRSLEGQGLVEIAAAPGDGRVRRAALTPRGRTEFEAYDGHSDRLADSILAPLSQGQRERLVEAMATVERLLLAGSLTVDVEAAASDDALACLRSYYAELAERFPSGFDPLAGNNFDPGELTPPKGWFVIARIDGEAVGCGALKRLDADCGEAKRVWTSRAVRGLGVASRIMDRLEALSAEAGFSRLRLDTNGALTEAQAMYRKRGYRDIARYNDNPYAEHWFEKVV